MSGETLEDYLKHCNLDVTRRKYLENIKEGKQKDNEIEAQYFNNGNRAQYSLIVPDRYFIYMKRFDQWKHNRHTTDWKFYYSSI
ncbi:MAG: hypothetical protein WA667_06385 [Candidatus Nitrosopolaris sp.]